ncbi:MAG: GvpL/GvpF family gas vesicle protein [Bacteroidota bacterium]
MNKMIYSILSLGEKPEKLNSLLVGMKGIAGADLNTVSFDKISAIVCDINRIDMVADQLNAIAYAGVIETMAQHFTLLPVRFGSVMESDEAIIHMLKKNYNDIQQNLLKVENKYEFGLKIFCEPEKLRAELRAKTEAEPIREPVQSNENSIYRDYLYKKLKEHRFEELLLAHVDAIIQDITTYLVQLNSIHKFKKMTTETNIIDAVFLLEKEKKDGLIRAVKDLQNQYAGFRFMLTGPWPPYNFVEFTIK